MTQPPPDATASAERRATVRIDAAPSGKKFQGVWLEFADRRRYVIDYRPRALWRGFADAEVIVTGHCYAPIGQAINSPHFRVERMRFAAEPTQSVWIVEIGPVTRMSGEFVEVAWLEGAKLAGTRALQFRSGRVYEVVGGEPRSPGPATILARALEVDRRHVATTAEPKLWLERVVDPEAPEREPAKVRCP